MPLSVYQSFEAYVGRIQKRLGSDVNMDRPEKNPASSTTVHASVRLRATSSLQEIHACTRIMEPLPSENTIVYTCT